MMRGPGTAAPPSPQWGMQSRCEYSLLALEEPEGDPATAETQVRGASHRATRGTEDQGRTETKTRDSTRQCALLERGMLEVNNQ